MDGQVEREREGFLAEASRRLAASLDVGDALAQLAELCVPRLADWTLVDLAGEDGALQRAMTAMGDERLEQAAVRELEWGVSASVARSGQSLLVADATPDRIAREVADPERRAFLEKTGVCSFMVVPLVARGRALGVVSFVATERSRRRYAPADLALAEDLASRAALAVDHARLHESERLLRQIFVNSADGIAVIDAQGRYLQQNEAHRRLVGYSDEELRGATPAIHLGDEAFGAIARELERSGRARGEYASRRKDGAQLTIDLAAFTVRDPKGRVLGHVGIKRDVTRRKTIESQLSRRIADLESIYRLTESLVGATTPREIHEAALDAVTTALRTPRASILLYDPAGVMRFVAWRGISEGYREAVEGHSPWKRDDPSPRPVLVEDVERADLGDSLRATVLGEGIRACAFIPLVHEGRLLGKFMVYDGQPRAFDPHEVRLAETIAGHVATAIARQRDKDDLNRSESWLRAVFESMEEAIFVVSYPERRFVSANRAAERILGWSLSELVGQSTELIHVDREAYEDFGRRAAEAFAQRETAHFEFRLRRKDGTVFPTAHALTFMPGPDGAPMGMMGVVQDITRRKESEAELEAARRQIAMTEKLSALGTLVSGVAHEIRTPLAYVTNNLYLIQQRMERAARRDEPASAPLPEVKRYSDDALEGADRINRIVGELRRFTKLKVAERTLAGLHEVVGEAVELFRSTHRGSVLVSADLQPTTPLRVDKVQTQQVVLNLLENAADAMATGGSIRVSVKALPDGADLRVTDTGPGIPPHVQERMFDPLFTTKADGTGLGLSITKRIVEDHGGTISFTTRAGQGTTFVVHLPLP